MPQGGRDAETPFEPFQPLPRQPDFRQQDQSLPPLFQRPRNHIEIDFCFSGSRHTVQQRHGKPGADGIGQDVRRRLLSRRQRHGARIGTGAFENDGADFSGRQSADPRQPGHDLNGHARPPRDFGGGLRRLRQNVQHLSPRVGHLKIGDPDGFNISRRFPDAGENVVDAHRHFQNGAGSRQRVAGDPVDQPPVRFGHRRHTAHAGNIFDFRFVNPRRRARIPNDARHRPIAERHADKRARVRFREAFGAGVIKRARQRQGQ